jgi:hypothetical protein
MIKLKFPLSFKLANIQFLKTLVRYFFVKTIVSCQNNIFIALMKKLYFRKKIFKRFIQ